MLGFKGFYSWWDAGGICNVSIVVLMTGGGSQGGLGAAWTRKDSCIHAIVRVLGVTIVRNDQGVITTTSAYNMRIGTPLGFATR